jgi:hypothetical protein
MYVCIHICSKYIYLYIPSPANPAFVPVPAKDCIIPRKKEEKTVIRLIWGDLVFK